MARPIGVRESIEAVWQRIKTVTPSTSATPGAPTGNLERWLVSHKVSGGILCVVWDHYWFTARERAESFTGTPRDRLALERLPLFADEKDGNTLSGAQIAERLGRPLHAVTESVQLHKQLRQLSDTLKVGPPAPASQCREVYTFKNGSSSSFCILNKGHKGEHVGWRAKWVTNGKNP